MKVATVNFTVKNYRRPEAATHGDAAVDTMKLDYLRLAVVSTHNRVSQEKLNHPPWRSLTTEFHLLV